MDGWTGEWTDGWVGEWMGGWTNGWVGGWKVEWVDGWAGGSKNGEYLSPLRQDDSPLR